MRRSRIYTALCTLEDRLLLNPKARRIAGVGIVEPAAAERNGNGNGRKKLPARERQRLLRG